MVNKKHLHHIWVKIRPISPWYFLAIAIASGVVFIFAYRQNNIQALSLRDKVLQVDQQDGDIEAALRELREFTYSHMNSSLAGGEGSIYPPIQLKYRYERLVKAEQEKAAATNAKVYSDAQVTCERLYPASVSGGPRVPCIQDYVTQHGGKEQSIPDALYKFDFVSPIWSADLAGWGLVVSVLSFLLFALWYGLERWVRSELNEH